MIVIPQRLDGLDKEARVVVVALLAYREWEKDTLSFLLDYSAATTTTGTRPMISKTLSGAVGLA